MENKKKHIKEWVKKNKRTTVFGICFMLSFSFWLLIKLSHDYNARVQFEIGFENIPEGKLLATEPIQFVEADIDAPGFSLLKNWLNPFRKIIIDLSVLNTAKKGKIEQAIWVTNNQKQLLGQQIPNGVRIVQVYPDTVYYNLSDLIEKKVPVLVSEALGFKNQFRKRGGIVVKPDSIVISGPRSIIDTVRYLLTEQWQEQNVDHTIRKKLSIRELNFGKNVSYSEKRVEAFVDVDQVTESEVEVLVEAKGVPEGYELKVFPRKVKVSYLVALRDFKRVTERVFKAHVVFPKTEGNQDPLLQVKALSESNLAEIIQTKPEKVEFIIRKK